MSQISRSDVDQCEPGKWIPECQLRVQWEKDDQKPVRLKHKVELIGAKEPYDFIHLFLNPGNSDTWCCSTYVGEGVREDIGTQYCSLQVIKRSPNLSWIQTLQWYTALVLKDSLVWCLVVIWLACMHVSSVGKQEAFEFTTVSSYKLCTEAIKST